MAGLNLVDALQGSLYSANESPYALLASGVQPIGQILASNPYRSTGSQMAYGIGGSLLAGLLSGLASRQAEQENQERYKIFGQLLRSEPTQRDALIEQNPWASNVGLMLANQDYISEQQAAAARAANELDIDKARTIETLKAGLGLQGDKEKMITQALADAGYVMTPQGPKGIRDLVAPKETPSAEQIQAQIQASGEGAAPPPTPGIEAPAGQLAQGPTTGSSLLASLDPFSKEGRARREDILKEQDKAKIEKERLGFDPEIAKAEDALRKEISTIPSVNQLSLLQKSLPLLEGFATKDTKSSDIGFVYNFVKAQDDGAVRGEEINLANTSNPVLQRMASELMSAYTGQSTLTPARKQEMLAELKDGRGLLARQALTDIDFRMKLGANRGLSAEAIMPFDIKSLATEIADKQSATTGIITSADGRRFRVDEANKKLIPVQ